MGKWKKKQENITYKRAKRSALSPQMTSSLHETDMALWQRQTQITKKIHKRSTVLERSVSKITGGFFVVKAYTCYVVDLMELAKEIQML